jgi:chromosome segregation ATPase
LERRTRPPPLERKRAPAQDDRADDKDKDGGRRPRGESRSASPEVAKDAAVKKARQVLQDAEDDLHNGKEDEVTARKAYKKLKATVEQEVEEQVRDEEEKLESELASKKKRMQSSLQRTLDETEERLKEELEDRIRDLKADFEEKLKDERVRLEEDSEKMEGDEIQDLKDKHAQRVKTLREDADNDKELVEHRERVTVAADKVADLEDDIVKAKKKIKSLSGGDLPARD